MDKDLGKPSRKRKTSSESDHVSSSKSKVAKNRKTAKSSTEMKDSIRHTPVRNSEKKTVVLDARHSSESAAPVAKKQRTEKLQPKWDLASVLSQSFQTSEDASRNFVKLVEADCTLPFIARYRREAVGNVSIETLQQMKSTVDELEQVKKKMTSVLKILDSQNHLNPEIQAAITASKTIEEIEHWYAPFKASKKMSNAAKAKDLGLEEIAMKVLDGEDTSYSLQNYVKKNVEGLENEEEIRKWVTCLIADRISKNEESIAQVRLLIKRCDARLTCSKSRSASKQTADNILKFQDYFEFNKPVEHVKPHQILAINRGEDLKILNVKITLSNFLQNSWTKFCNAKFLSTGSHNPLRKQILSNAIEEAFSKTVEPFAIRKLRASLNEEATKASIQVFSSNLRQMLLLPPLRGRAVLGLDPGFKNGCKCALVSSEGSFLESIVIYPKFTSTHPDAAAADLRRLLHGHQCTIIALGNGTACRETEAYLSRLIHARYFQPLDIVYTIVSENGASIYSCTPEARQDYPNLDPNIISAISIAKRLQDPLAELVRVSARHLGVGMYQHDISAAKLESALDDVVVECVSFVGVDLNTSPLHLLSQVAGIGAAKAKHIIQWRESNGPFICRQQLLEVKSIGPKTFEQCAGFLKIMPVTTADTTKKAKGSWKKYSVNPLDRTSIHPESYGIANRIVELCQGRLDDVGSASFIKCLEEYLQATTMENLAITLGVSLAQLQQIVESLLQPIEHDLRHQFEKPLFRRGLTSLDDLEIGTELTGKVTNVTHFGAFVDVGVGIDALLHTSKMKGRNREVTVGANVKVHVSSIDRVRRRLGVSLF